MSSRSKFFSQGIYVAGSCSKQSMMFGTIVQDPVQAQIGRGNNMFESIVRLGWRGAPRRARHIDVISAIEFEPEACAKSAPSVHLVSGRTPVRSQARSPNAGQAKNSMPEGESISVQGATRGRRGRRPIPFLLGAISLLASLKAYDVLAARFWPHIPGELNLLWHVASGIAAAAGAFAGASLGHWIDRRLTRILDRRGKALRE